MQKRKQNNVLLTVALVAFVIYICVSLVLIYSQYNDKQKQLDSLNRQIQEQMQENQDSKRLLSEDDDGAFAERYAREKLGYARPEERVFYNITG